MESTTTVDVKPRGQAELDAALEIVPSVAGGLVDSVKGMTATLSEVFSAAEMMLDMLPPEQRGLAMAKFAKQQAIIVLFATSLDELVEEFDAQMKAAAKG